jgi:hypothetical protein
MSIELIVALSALGVSLLTAIVVLSRPAPACRCRLDVPSWLSVSLMSVVDGLHHVATSVNRLDSHAHHMPDPKADRAQQHAMRLSRALNGVDEP